MDAKVLTSPQKAMKDTFGNDCVIKKEKLNISQERLQNIEQTSKAKFNTKTTDLFKALKSGKTVGYGILINSKIRTKNGVVLYAITDSGSIKAIEIIAFNEPMEYIPSKKWIEQFEKADSKNINDVSQKAHALTGATMSANIVKDGSRTALAVFNEILKGK